MAHVDSTAMQVALNILGFTCYHSVLFFSNIKDCAAWSAALDAKFFDKGTPFTKREWDALLGSFSAISADPPAIAFAQELVELYPEAKVILVERNVDAWYSSMNEVVIKSSWSPFLNFLADLDPWLVGPIRDCHHRWIKGWWKANTMKEMQEKARSMYTEHYALVRKVTPKERLLEYRLGDGWEPLCQFLGKPVPDVPFPNVNDKAHMNETLAIMAKQSIVNVLKNGLRYAVPLAAAGLAWWMWKL